jgi:hypothetical protein
MIQLVQRIPNYFSGFTSQKYDFSSYEDLNNFIFNPPNNCFLTNWNNKADFIRFEIRKNYSQKLLICVLSERSWAIAWIKENENNNPKDINNNIVDRTIL